MPIADIELAKRLYRATAEIFPHRPAGRSIFAPAHRPPLAIGLLPPGFWVTILFGRTFELDNKRGVTLGLLAKAQKDGRQIFKLGPHRQVVFDLRSGKKLKGLRPMIIPRRHSELPTSFYTSLQCNAAKSKSFRIRGNGAPLISKWGRNICGKLFDLNPKTVRVCSRTGGLSL